MRIHGTLTKWNDDRGFGFITPAKGDRDIFVHVSAFPRAGGRPAVGELISFEVETAPDGKHRAARVMRPGQKSLRHAAHRRPAAARGGWVGIAASLLVIAAIGVYGFTTFRRYSEARASASVVDTMPMASKAVPGACDGRTMCSQMTSCQEATYFIRNCPNTAMDGDGDGVPCESQWCRN